MSRLDDARWSRTLAAWVARDALIAALSWWTWQALRRWHAEADSGASLRRTGIAWAALTAVLLGVHHFAGGLP